MAVNEVAEKVSDNFQHCYDLFLRPGNELGYKNVSQIWYLVWKSYDLTLFCHMCSLCVMIRLIYDRPGIAEYNIYATHAVN